MIRLGRARWRARIMPRLCASLLAAFLVWWPGLASGQAPAARTPRVVTLAPSVTELVFAAGAGDRIVGTVLSSDYPPQATQLPRIGDGLLFNEEAILALQPTLVLGWQDTPATRALARRLATLNIPLHYVEPRTLDDIPRWIRWLGGQLGTASVAHTAAAGLQARIAALDRHPAQQASVYIEVGQSPLYTLGNDPLINDLLHRCGGRNLYADSPLAAPQTSVEAVLRQDPDLVIVSPDTAQGLSQRRAWWARYGLPAALAGRIEAIPADWLFRPGPRLVDAAEALCAVMP
ncbi:cobalamin-binding protein [Castellaniella sp.]|uniref:cobalamin-binding protein n=1 Tax=Castellaniella sp. TaxID=1955812 RepID=UPI00356B2279